MKLYRSTWLRSWPEATGRPPEIAELFLIAPDREEAIKKVARLAREEADWLGYKPPDQTHTTLCGDGMYIISRLL